MDETHGDQATTTKSAQQPGASLPPASVIQEVEVIIARQLAGYLSQPVVIMDPSHVIIYYNEPAERMLGRLYEGDEIIWKDWTATFRFRNDDGEPIPAAEMPLGVAMRERRVAHRTFQLFALDGGQHRMHEVAIPLLSTSGRFLGAMAIFAEAE